MNSDICTAINERRLLEIFYDPGSRIIEPHALGLGSDRNELLRAFQVSGASGFARFHRRLAATRGGLRNPAIRPAES